MRENEHEKKKVGHEKKGWTTYENITYDTNIYAHTITTCYIRFEMCARSELYEHEN